MGGLVKRKISRVREVSRFTQVEACSQTSILDMSAAVLSANAVTEVLAPKFDATAGFQPTVLS